MTFKHICSMLAAYRCYRSGQSVKAIAASAGRSESTIRRWIRTVRRPR